MELLATTHSIRVAPAGATAHARRGQRWPPGSGSENTGLRECGSVRGLHPFLVDPPGTEIAAQWVGRGRQDGSGPGGGPGGGDAARRLWQVIEDSTIFFDTRPHHAN